MLKYSEALELLLAAARERGLRPHQTVPLELSLGRVASSSLSSREDLPPFDNSAMDGFAVAAARTAGASAQTPVTLPVSAVIAAGDTPSCAAHPGAVEIMTGATIPPGCDAVVRVEDVERLNGGTAVALREPASAGDFVRRRGADFAAGTAILAAGQTLQPRHLLALAALGHARVPVRISPRVAIVSTGKELVAFDKKPGPGQIRNATAPYLKAELETRGAQVLFSLSVGDEPGAFAARLEELLEEDLDLILATGGVSMGRHDYVPSVIAELGAETLFHKAAVRPGKPVLAASFGNGPLFLGLPGNPISTVMAARFFVDPLLRCLMGRAPETPRRARLAERVDKPAGLRCFFKGALEESVDGPRARCLPGQASFQIKPLLDADCWVVLPEEPETLAAGTEVEVFPL
jgi:molybdopterin molybdotransferase